MTPGGDAPATVASDRGLACGNCLAPMRRVSLDGHYGTSVDLDICESCDLVWFDGTETARLSGPGMLDLIGDMAKGYDLPFEPLRSTASCPRCKGRLALVHNQSRWGKSVQLQCVARDGAYQSFAEFLEEKGLLRPMSRLDRAGLLQQKGRIDCVNCGGAVGRDDERCPFCHSVPSLLDVARLARALDPEGMLGSPAVHDVQPRQEAMQCAACGAPLPPGEAMSCAQCGATLAIPSLQGAVAAVQVLAAALRANAAHPPAEVVQRRLAAIDADAPRQREWAADMAGDTRRDAVSTPDDRDDWPSYSVGGVTPARVIYVALAIWFAWEFWHRR